MKEEIRVIEGEYFTSRGGTRYRVVSLDGKGGFTVERPETGKTVKISGRLIGSLLDRIAKGESFAYQKNANQGGISYTVAVEAGAVHALRHLLDRDDAARAYVPKGGGDE
mgnify:CR=1 FL=1